MAIQRNYLQETVQLEGDVDAIDVAGKGDTTWSGIETDRARAVGDRFRNWGLPTAVSTIETLRLELETAMFVTGSRTISDLRDADHVVLGRTRE